MRLITIFMLTFLFTMNADAKRFANKYSEFELPAGWECELEGSEWVCQSSNNERKKEAIIILAAKLRGEEDDIDKYQAFLKNTKTYTLPGGKKQVAEPKYTKVKTINEHRWVDSLHLASEVPGFYTRYLATVKEDLGIAVTFSVSKDHYSAYQAVFDKIIESLRVFRQRKIDVGDLKKGDGENLLDSVAYIPDDLDSNDMSYNKNRGKRAGGASSNMLFLILIIGAVVAFIVLKKLKKKK